MSRQASLKRSPFFYVGDKYKLIEEIREHFPGDIGTFVEPFLGGGSVFLNVDAQRYLLNDIDGNVISLHKFLSSKADSENKLVNRIKKIVQKYNLSRSVFEDVVPQSLKKEWVKTYYAKFNNEGYLSLRDHYNKSKSKDPLILYLLLIYGFNRMLRFNKKGDFNVPVGNVDFNNNVLSALKDYFEKVRENKVKFYNQDFRDFINGPKLKQNDFVYVDPPYLISASEYNKLWNEENDLELMQLLDDLTRKRVRFALSNITSYNGHRNQKLITWSKKYNVIPIQSNYISYHDNTKKKINEVLITNY